MRGSRLPVVTIPSDWPSGSTWRGCTGKSAVQSYIIFIVKSRRPGGHSLQAPSYLAGLNKGRVGSLYDEGQVLLPLFIRLYGPFVGGFDPPYG